MSFRPRGKVRMGWLAPLGLALAVASYSCDDDGDDGGTGGTTSTGTGGATGGAGGAAGGAGGGGAGGEGACTRCNVPMWIDASGAEPLCQSNGPPSSQETYDELVACACELDGPCVTDCNLTVCAGQDAAPNSTCTTCMAKSCYLEYWACLEDKVTECNDGDGCTLIEEDCSCADCAGNSYCNEDQCVTDDSCTLDDACTCADCWEDAWCSDPDYCYDDDECFAYWEGCHCADCADEPNCQGYGTGGAGGGGGAGGN